MSADVVPNGLPFTLNFLRHLSLFVAFDHLGQTSYALQLIKNSPSLSKLEIWVSNISKLCGLALDMCMIWFIFALHIWEHGRGALEQRQSYFCVTYRSRV